MIYLPATGNKGTKGRALFFISESHITDEKPLRFVKGDKNGNTIKLPTTVFLFKNTAMPRTIHT